MATGFIFVQVRSTTEHLLPTHPCISTSRWQQVPWHPRQMAVSLCQMHAEQHFQIISAPPAGPHTSLLCHCECRTSCDAPLFAKPAKQRISVSWTWQTGRLEETSRPTSAIPYADLGIRTPRHSTITALRHNWQCGRGAEFGAPAAALGQRWS